MEAAQAQLRRAIDEMVNLPHGATPEQRQAAQAKIEEARKAIFAAGDAMRSKYRSMPYGPSTPGMIPGLPGPPRGIMMIPKKTGSIVCCPKCLRDDRNRNTTTPLNRKQLRKKPMSHGFPLHPSSFCVYCNERMVTMPMEDYARRQREEVDRKMVEGRGDLKKWK